MMKEQYVSTSMLVLLVLACGAVLGASLPEHREDDNQVNSITVQENNINPGRTGRKLPFFEMTKALIKEQARLSSTSEVLTLNLTNLIILIVVKAIIFGFGFLGAAGRRSTDSSPQQITFNQSDLMMMMTFALGSTTKDYDCFYRTACEDPETAQQYMTASKMLLKGAKYFKK